jgi:hypothetical protein
MNKKSIVLMMLLTLPLILPLFAMNANAVTVTQDGTNTNNIEWIDSTSYAKLALQPQFLSAEVAPGGVPIITNTTLIIDGTDALGQNIEAETIFENTSTNPSAPQWTQEFVDVHSGMPVAFSTITNIYQQNGTDGNKFMISTMPEDYSTANPNGYQQYLGEYHSTVKPPVGYGWNPGVYSQNGLNTGYWVTNGPGVAPTQQNVAFQPQHPEEIIIYANWFDNNHDLVVDGYQAFPVAGTDVVKGAYGPGTIWIEGLNQAGQKLIENFTFITGQQSIASDCFAEIDKVWGGNNGDSYYIFTYPQPSVNLFDYFVKIDHMTISPDSYDILAYPYVIDGAYPGVTDVSVTLRDIDGNIVNWAGGALYGNTTYQYIILSFFTSGGEIEPSSNVFIKEEQSTATVNLTADTNPRTITVACDANVPGLTLSGGEYYGEMNLYVWTNITFDGINTHPNTAAWPIDTMQWGYTDAFGTTVTKNVPAKPVLPPELGGPAPDGIKLDGPIYEVMIPLYVGCNLISSPVYPMLGDYNSGYAGGLGIPMDLLFGHTSATTSIEAIWWYTEGNWHVYIPGTADPDAYFTDGVGYWIKAEKACTLEISGVAMENGPFKPNAYQLEPQSWNLVGFTSVNPMLTSSYLESTMGSTGIEAVGPVWVYSANSGSWTRDPSMLWPTQALWVFNKVPDTLYIAP